MRCSTACGDRVHAASVLDASFKVTGSARGGDTGWSDRRPREFRPRDVVGTVATRAGRRVHTLVRTQLRSVNASTKGLQRGLVARAALRRRVSRMGARNGIPPRQHIMTAVAGHARWRISVAGSERDFVTVRGSSRRLRDVASLTGGDWIRPSTKHERHFAVAAAAAEISMHAARQGIRCCSLAARAPAHVLRAGQRYGAGPYSHAQAEHDLKRTPAANSRHCRAVRCSRRR